MQERRTTIRFPHRCRIQYCPAEDLELRDGRLTNVSERGAALLVQEQHRVGELVTLGFTLPGESGALTATGVVRWSGAPPRGARWHPLGVDWLPLEETARHRLQQYLERASQAASPRRAVGPPLVPPRVAIPLRIIGLAGATGALLAALLVALRIQALRAENRRLAAAVEQRELLIQRLARHERELKAQLDTTRGSLLATAGDVVRLNQEVLRFGQEVAQLNAQVDRFQRSSLQVRQERDQLMGRVSTLEQERTSLARRLSSVDALRLAIREAIDARKEARRLSLMEAQRDADQQLLVSGNQGYLIRDGRPTVGAATMWIRVRQPRPGPVAENSTTPSAP